MDGAGKKPDPGLKRSKSRFLVWGGSGLVVLVLATVAFFVVHILSSEDSSKRRRAVQSVTLVKPPPPPEKIKEKPPEPEVKKEEIVEKKPDKPQEQPEEKDEPPPGDRLGLDTEGGAGADEFGLVAKKGGAALIGGGGNLMRQYAWYTAKIQEELRKKIYEHMEQNGGVPSGSCRASVQIRLDDQGRIIGHRIEEACGIRPVDEALEKVLSTARISEPPPEEMPRSIKIRVSTRG